MTFTPYEQAVLNKLDELIRLLKSEQSDEEQNLVFPIEDYLTFDWASIGARITRSDDDGPTHVQCNGAVYYRRTKDKFGHDVWFSRGNGKDENGEPMYQRLITFKEFGEVDPVGRQTKETLEQVKATVPAQKPIQQSAQEPVKRNPIPEGPKAPEKPAFMDVNEFKKKATGNEFGISWEIARKIAYSAGVIAAEQDFSPAVQRLPYYAEAIANGMDFETAKAILLECETLTDATISMRRNYPHQEPIL